jgi:hypothetical protein
VAAAVVAVQVPLAQVWESCRAQAEAEAEAGGGGHGGCGAQGPLQPLPCTTLFPLRITAPSSGAAGSRHQIFTTNSGGGGGSGGPWATPAGVGGDAAAHVRMQVTMQVQRDCD